MSDSDAAVLRHAIAMGGWLSAHGVVGTGSDHERQMLRLVAAGLLRYEERVAAEVARYVITDAGRRAAR
jgi:hypothetical protein